MSYNNFDDFYRARRRFGWSLERAREHYNINRGIRNRFIPNAQLEEVELEDLLVDNEELDEFINDANEGWFDETNEELFNEQDLIEMEAFGVADESVALLGGAGSAGAAAVGGISTGGAIATGAAVLAGGAAIGGIISYINQEDGDDRPVITAPDHNYLGPGNDESAGLEPFDLDDEIAKEHDIR